MNKVMITEDFVSFEVAKLLKEKGFDEPCIRHWDCDGHSLYGYNDIPISNSELQANEYNGYAAPTHQMAMKWLREVYNIAIEPMLLSNGWFCQIERILDGFCKEYICETDSYKTYEEAVEAAIKYSLENLI